MDAMLLRNMFCTECSLQFNKKIVFDLHLSLVHGKKTNIKQEPNNCELTSEDTETINENHNAEKPFGCKICDSEFAFQDDLNGHIASVHKVKRLFKCDISDASYSLKTGLRHHILSVHKNKRFSCAKCDEVFTKNEHLKKHVALVHEEKRPSFKCKICDGNYSTKQILIIRPNFENVF